MASPTIDMGVLSIIGLGGRPGGQPLPSVFRRSASPSLQPLFCHLAQSMAAWLLDLEESQGV